MQFNLHPCRKNYTRLQLFNFGVGIIARLGRYVAPKQFDLKL